MPNDLVITKPGDRRNTHHFSLSDGVTCLGFICMDRDANANPTGMNANPSNRTALKTTTGNNKYADYQEPWSPIAQSDWSGGRGQADFENNTTMFHDSHRATTMFGSIFLGGEATLTKGYRNQDYKMPGSVKWNSLIAGPTAFMAKQFTASASYNVTTMSFWIRRFGIPTVPLTIELCSNSAGDPGGVLKSKAITITDVTDTISILYDFLITSQAVVSGTSYWVKIYSTGDSENHWEVGYDATAGATGTTKISSVGTAGNWNATNDYDLYYRVRSMDVDTSVVFFFYKYALYCVRNVPGGNPKLYISGDRGVTDSNAGDLAKLNDTAKNWGIDVLIDAVVSLTNGPGFGEKENFRKITSNIQNQLTISPNFTIDQSTTTEYVIQGANIWTEITGHGLVGTVSDVLVVNNIAYFCLGEATAIRRMKWEQSGGAEAITWDNDGTNMATLLCTVRNSTTGFTEIWRANNSTTISVSVAPVVDWGTNLTFGAVEGTSLCTFKDSWGRITGLEEYGDTSKYLWVLREGTAGQVVNGKFDEMPIKEIRTLMSGTNGLAHTTHNAYLMWNINGMIESYANSLLADVGPTQGEGFPPERQGTISAMIGYPGMYFAAVKANLGGISSITCSNLLGYHEIYRSPVADMKINRMVFQSIPGDTPDRLWIAEGEDLVSVNFPSGLLNPTRDANYRYTHEGDVTTSWYYAGLPDIYKIYKSMKIFAEELTAQHQFIRLDYQVDTDTIWSPLPEVFEHSPLTEVRVRKGKAVTAKRIRFRIRMITDDHTKTPIIKTTVLDTISRIPVVYGFTFPVVVWDGQKNLKGQVEKLSAWERMQKLIEWAINVEALTQKSKYRAFDNFEVFIDPIPYRPFAEGQEKYAFTISATELPSESS